MCLTAGANARSATKAHRPSLGNWFLVAEVTTLDKHSGSTGVVEEKAT